MKYRLELTIEENNIEQKIHRSYNYRKIYLEDTEYVFSTRIGIRINENDELISYALIGCSTGGPTILHDTSQVIENDRLVICCSDSIFCLSIPDLDLKWKIQTDSVTCLEIFRIDDGYIVHGELEIFRIDNDGKIKWQRSGADIYVTPDGNNFKITYNIVIVTDWEYRKYKLILREMRENKNKPLNF